MKARELELKAHSLHERFHTNALMPTTKSPKPPSAIPDTPIMTIVLLTIPTFLQTYPALLKPKPETRPEGFPDGRGGWPLYFAPLAFRNNRAFGIWFMIGLILDVALRLIPAASNFWR